MTHGVFVLAVSISILTATWSGISFAQSCCSPATTPSNAVAHAGTPRGKFQLGLYAEHFQLEGGRRGTESFDFPGDRQSSAQAIVLAGRYGFSDRISASVLLPYIRRERSDLTLDGDRVSRSYSGFGDLAVLGYFRLTPPISRTEWTVGGGLKFATGASRAEDDTGELPEEIQPGTGANDVILTTLFTQGIGVGFSASAGLTWRITGTLTKIDIFPATQEEVTREFRFGNELIYGAGGAWTPDEQWGFMLGIQGRHAKADESTSLNPDGTTGELETLPSTGGERVWLTPTVRFAPLTSKAAVSLGILVPIYENLLGSQLSTKPGLRFTLESSF
jgi:hypothetical protein